ncbi:hypothetical protein ACIHFD_57300 [Nonomuraea sp. NPDC051941]|uniref:hypothetical protein n=1 Tax=Nonomuraea sp. NPDC051941 TaxID=3364373 RepID=UPI0037C843D4
MRHIAVGRDRNDQRVYLVTQMFGIGGAPQGDGHHCGELLHRLLPGTAIII